jgi:hypothetical protein
MFLSKTVKIVLNIGANIKGMLEPEDAIYILDKADKFIIDNAEKLRVRLTTVNFSVNKSFKTPVIPTLCVIAPPYKYETARDPFWNLAAAMLYVIINTNNIRVFFKGDKKLEELVYKVVPGVLLPEKNDPLLKELETTLDSLALDTDSKWFERYGFKPVLVNINIMNWIRTFTTSYIHVWLTENDKWQAKTLWYRARGRASMTSKECNSYQDALKEILPGIKELFDRENRKLGKK